MSVCRPARCLLSASTAALPKPKHPRPASASRPFSSSAPCAARKRRPHYPSIKASDLALLNQSASQEYPALQASETELLAKKYTPAQLDAIRAAEAAIDPKDIYTQGQLRTDPWKLPYEDDLAEVDPISDHATKLGPEAIKGRKDYRLANDVERDESLQRIATEQLAKMYPDGIPSEAHNTSEWEQATDTAIMQASLDPRVIYKAKHPEVLEALADPRHSVILPELPRLENRMVRQTRRLANAEEEDYRNKNLLKYMGWDKQKLREIRTKTLIVHGVTNQTRMGKIRSLYYLTIAGNNDGLLGVGEGKSVEPDEGRKQSIISAIRNLRPVPRYENRTIYGDLEKKVGATKVQLFSRPPGFGLRTQHLIFEMARAAGLHDLAARTPRSRNKMNVIKATWEALTSQKLPDEIARARGKKLVDVRKVYYGGSVH